MGWVDCSFFFGWASHKSHESHKSHPFYSLWLLPLQLAAPPLVSKLKSDDRRKSIATRGRRQFRDLLTCFSDGIINDPIARAVNDREFRDSSIRLNLEANIDYEGCASGDLTVRLVPRGLKPILDDLSVKTDLCCPISGGRTMFLSLAVPGSRLMFFGLTIPLAAILLCSRAIFRLLSSFP